MTEGSAMPQAARAGHEPSPTVSAVPVTIPIARPGRNDPAVRAAAILSLAEECANWGDGGSVDGWVTVLRDVHMNDNGFEIAKDLDRYGRVNGVDAELVEILDSASSYLWTAHDAAVAAWVARENVVADLPVGARVSCRHGIGTISEIKAEGGYYLFVPDNEREKYARGGGYHLNFEDAQGIAAQSDETLKAAQPEGQEPGPKDAPTPSGPKAGAQSTPPPSSHKHQEQGS